MEQNKTNQLRQRKKIRNAIGPGTIIAWILTGLLLAMIAIQFRLGGHWNPERFYDVGSKYAVSYEWYTVPYDGMEYQADGMYHLTGDTPSMPIIMNKDVDQEWNYLYIKTENISTGTLKSDISLINTQGAAVWSKTVTLKDGMNIIKFPGVLANQMTLTFPGQQGTSFWISYMQLRQYPSYFTVPKVAAMLGLFLCFYFPVTFLLYRLFLARMKISRLAYLAVDGLSAIYRVVLSLLEKLLPKIPDRIISAIRKLIFTGMILYMLYTEDYGYYNNWDYYKVYLAVNGGLLFLICFLSLRQEKRKVNWKNPLIFSWIVYSILSCISDLLVPKTQMYTGIFMFAVMGFLFYAIARMKSSIQILWDFSFAVIVVYWLSAVFCLVSRPVTSMIEGRYNGMTIAPASFALFLGIVIAIFFSEIDRCIVRKKNLLLLVFHLIGLSSAMYFMWITQSRDGVLALGVCGLLFLFRTWFMRWEKGYIRRWFLAAALLVITAVPVIWAQDWALHNLPGKLGTIVYFDKDERMIDKPENKEAKADDESNQEIYDPISGMTVWASDGANQDHLFKKSTSLDILSSGRITIYSEYIANMNLWGHEGDPIIGKGKMRAHNAVLQTGYRYGALTMVPYVVMILFTLIYAVRYAFQNWKDPAKHPILPIGLMLSIGVMMMLDNVERNFRYLPWIAFYLLIGVLSNVESE